MRKVVSALALTTITTGLVMAQAPAPPQPAGPPRGASGPPEHAKVDADQQPAQSLRNDPQLGHAAGRPASGDRSAPCTSIPTASTSGPAIAAAATSAPDSKVDPMVKLDPTGKVVASFGAGQILWPHGMDVDKQGNVWVADARSATAAGAREVSRCQGQGPHRDEVQPARQAADDDRHAAARPAIRRRSSPSPTTCWSLRTAASSSPKRTTRSSSIRIRRTAIGRISKLSPDGKLIKTFGTVRLRREPVPRTAFARDGFAAAGCSWPIAAIAAS